MSPLTLYKPGFPILYVLALDNEVLGAIIEVISIFYKYSKRI